MLRFNILVAFVLAFATCAFSAPMPVEALAPAVIEERDVLETRANKKVVKKPSQKTVKKAAKKAPAKPKSTPALYTSSSSFSGQATWFTQDGNPGSCGKWSNDNTLLVALNSPQVRASGNKCGSWVVVKNNANGKTVKAQVLDECPGCGWGSLDLSLGAFKALGNLDSGVLPISWSWA